MQAEPSDKPESCVVIAGVGLIGGSIAAAIRARSPQTRVLGLGRSRQRLESAQQAGLLDDILLDEDAASLPSGALAVICLPVDRIADTTRRLARRSPDDVLFTDAGSVKSLICRDVSSDPCAAARFVGAHPIAGGEKTGCEHATADLFQGRCCIVTPDRSPADRLDRVCRFWQHLGCRVTTMTPEEHDRIVAAISHLPHILSAITALCQQPTDLEFAGSGFRDTTRIAAGDPQLWLPILQGNADHVLRVVRRAQQRLASLAEALQQGDADTLSQLLTEAAAIRRGIERD